MQNFIKISCNFYSKRKKIFAQLVHIFVQIILIRDDIFRTLERMESNPTYYKTLLEMNPPWIEDVPGEILMSNTKRNMMKKKYDEKEI